MLQRDLSPTKSNLEIVTEFCYVLIHPVTPQQHATNKPKQATKTRTTTQPYRIKIPYPAMANRSTNATHERTTLPDLF